MLQKISVTNNCCYITEKAVLVPFQPVEKSWCETECERYLMSLSVWCWQRVCFNLNVFQQFLQGHFLLTLTPALHQEVVPERVPLLRNLPTDTTHRLKKH